MKKYCIAGQAKDDITVHAGYLRLQTHSEYVILFVFPLQQRLRERRPMLRYTYMACLVVCDDV